MSEVKDEMIKIIQTQPENATFEEILKELAFEKMIQSGLMDAQADRIISNDKMRENIKSWGK